MYDAPLLDEPAREALRLASAALDAAQAKADPYGMTQALLQLAGAHTQMNAPACAETYLQIALRWARNAHASDLTVDVLCELSSAAETVAEAQDACAPGSGHVARERARDHAYEASMLASRVADPQWEMKVLLRISDVLDRCGDRADAVQMQTRALRLMAGPAAETLNPHVMPVLGRLADQ